MINVLIQLLILGLVLYVANIIVGMLTFDARLKQIILVVIAVIGLLWLLQGFGALLPY